MVKKLLVISWLLFSSLTLGQTPGTAVIPTAPAVTLTTPAAVPATTVTTTAPAAVVPATTVTGGVVPAATVTTAPGAIVPATTVTTAPGAVVPATAVTTAPGVVPETMVATPPVIVTPGASVTGPPPIVNPTVVTPSGEVVSPEVSPEILPTGSVPVPMSTFLSDTTAAVTTTSDHETKIICPPLSNYPIPPGYRLAGLSPSCLAVPIPWDEEPIPF